MSEQYGKIKRVTLEYEKMMLTIEGEQAETWSKAVSAQETFCGIHHMPFPEIAWTKIDMRTEAEIQSEMEEVRKLVEAEERSLAEKGIVKKDLAYYKRLPYTLKTEKIEGEPGGTYWLAWYEELNGAKADGETEQAAIASVQELFDEFIELRIEDGVVIPEPTAPSAPKCVWTDLCKKPSDRGFGPESMTFQYKSYCGPGGSIKFHGHLPVDGSCPACGKPIEIREAWE